MLVCDVTWVCGGVCGWGAQRKTGEGGQTPEVLELMGEVAKYRGLVEQMREEFAQKEQELRAEADRRVEEVRASLSSEIERLSAKLKHLVQQQHQHQQHSAYD